MEKDDDYVDMNPLPIAKKKPIEMKLSSLFPFQKLNEENVGKNPRLK